MSAPEPEYCFWAEGQQHTREDWAQERIAVEVASALGAPANDVIVGEVRMEWGKIVAQVEVCAVEVIQP